MQGKYNIDMYKEQQRRPIWRSKGIRTGWEMRVGCGFFSLCDAKSSEGFEKSEVILIHVLKESLWFPLLGMTLSFVCLVNSYMFGTNIAHQRSNVPRILHREHTSRRQDINAKNFSLYTPESKETRGRLTTLSALCTFLYMVGRSNRIMTNNFYIALMIIILQVFSY